MDSNDTITCAQLYEKATYYGLLYFRVSLAIVSILSISSMLVIMVLFKKYRFFTQRLILYLAISTLAYQIVSAIDVTSIRAYSNEKPLNYCKAIGFLTQIILWWPIISINVIVFDIFVRVVLKKPTERLELPYVLLIFCLSPLINWIPFLYSSYGPAQYYCWFQTKDTSDNCQSKDVNGLIFSIALYFVPWYILVPVMIVLLGITLFHLRRWRKTYTGKFDPQAVEAGKKIEQEIKPLVYYPIIFIVSSLVAVVVIVLSLTQEYETVFAVSVVISIIIFRLQGVFLTLVFVFDPETRKKLNASDIRGAVSQFFKKEECYDYPAEYNIKDDAESDTHYVQSTVL